MRDGSYQDPQKGKTLFKAVAKDWFEWFDSQDKSRTTLKSYREALDNYVLPHWGSHQLQSIRKTDVRKWVTRLGSEPGLRGKKLSPATIRKNFRVFSAVLNFAVEEDLIAVNRANGVKLPKVTAKPEEDRVYLTHAQLEDLAEAAGDYRLLVLVLGYCGLRWGEASAIRVKDVNMEEHRIWVGRAFINVSGRLYVGQTKTREPRKVSIPPSVVEELRPLLKDKAPDDLLFTTVRGCTLRYANWREQFDSWVKKAGLPLSMTPHDLRHTCASLCVAAGADVTVVQRQLGHANPAMTLTVYTHLFPDRLDEVSSVLDSKRQAALKGRHLALVPDVPAKSDVS